MEKIVGIRDEKLKLLILDIYDYRDKISKILDTAEILLYKTSDYYNSEDGEALRTKFLKFSSNFSVFLSNITSYGLDLENVLASYKKNDSDIIDIFKS